MYIYYVYNIQIARATGMKVWATLGYFSPNLLGYTRASMTDNRSLAANGEYVTVSCTHCPSNQPSLFMMKLFEGESWVDKVG